MTGEFAKGEKDILEAISLEQVKESNGYGWLSRAYFGMKDYDRSSAYATRQLDKGVLSRNSLYCRGCISMVDFGRHFR